MTIEEVLQHDLKFRYMLLGRLQADCEYYLGFGNKSSRRLWAGSEKAQIEYMTKIHDSFRENEKPEWLTMEQIKEYSNAMEVCYIVGFNSSSYFAKCFQKQFGVLPKDFYKNGS